MCLYILVFTFLVCSPVYMQMCIQHCIPEPMWRFIRLAMKALYSMHADTCVRTYTFNSQ